MAMEIRKIRALIEMVETSDISELEIREGEEVVRITRHHTPAVAPSPMIAAPQYLQPMVNMAVPHSQNPVESNSTPTPPSTEHLVRSPMVGTMYTSSAPGQKTFVEIGQKVNVGDVLCIVEAMKMMNQIEADKAGTIKKRFVENGEPVEFDQPLFVIE
ncbi:MAG: Biotin carboxyl carrier protein of acetyl-CoA carboxylase [Legionellaceae bacterium]